MFLASANKDWLLVELGQMLGHKARTVNTCQSGWRKVSGNDDYGWHNLQESIARLGLNESFIF